MAGKLQGKVRATWDVKPDGSLDTGALVDLAPNQLQRRGASLAYCCAQGFPDLPPLGTLGFRGFPGSVLGILFSQFLVPFWVPFLDLVLGASSGASLNKLY